MTSILIHIMLKSYTKDSEFRYKDLLLVFFLPFTISFCLLALNGYFDFSYIINLMLLPFYIRIIQTSSGDFASITLAMDGPKASGSTDTSSGPKASGSTDASPSSKAGGSGNDTSKTSNPGIAALEVFDARRDLAKVGKQLRYLTDQLKKLQKDNGVKVMQDSVGYMSLDVSARMSNEEGEKLSKRACVIACAFEDQCVTYETLAKEGLEKKAYSISLSNKADSKIHKAFDKEVSKLNDIKREYHENITFH